MNKGQDPEPLQATEPTQFTNILDRLESEIEVFGKLTNNITSRIDIIGDHRGPIDKEEIKPVHREGLVGEFDRKLNTIAELNDNLSTILSRLSNLF